MYERGNAAKSGSQGFKRLEALDILPLPICLRNGSVVSVEQASDYEFSAWLRWNGIPFTGHSEWTFDSKCAVINHALRHGLKPRLIAAPGNSLGNCSGHLSEMFEYPKPQQNAEDNKPPDGAA